MSSDYSNSTSHNDSISQSNRVVENNKITLKVPCDLIEGTYNDVPSITAISRFHIIPNTQEDWLSLIVNNEGERVAVEQLKIQFTPARPGQEYLEGLQRIFLLCDIENKTSEGEWAFAANGIVIPKEPELTDFEITTELLNDKKQLLIIIDKVGNTGSEPGKTHYLKLGFNFVATCTNMNGYTKAYLSQDPSVDLGRPIGG
ncbi:hypothetical protein [Pleionea litopenaei]|uniref:Uncharacterized protein n=1 Tax=Pleionea litopenaei TaxID=3070815 RepID=A0AA51RT69_9GAMM|nr:hypothetical protein [Pleionea sp. HL-JVS1]WMS87019.1 hypothetical protein Q9312_17535 [Pleionea sp. HL-JVS1]